MTLPLFAYLLPRARKHVNRSQRPCGPTRAARANLRRHLYTYSALPPARRKAMAARHDETLQWNPSAPWSLDVADFERLSAGAETLSAAVALYSGDLLENVYDDWLFVERACASCTRLPQPADRGLLPRRRSFRCGRLCTTGSGARSLPRGRRSAVDSPALRGGDRAGALRT
jgi:hypothetical protein